VLACGAFHAAIVTTAAAIAATADLRMYPLLILKITSVH
jgi:hypothetical protein